MIFVTRIPTHYNDGKRISKKVRQEIAADFFATFGGCTLEGPGEGMWADEQGNVYAEESFRLEVGCARNRYSEARSMVIALGRRLNQKAMYFEIRYFDGLEIIEIIQ